MDSEETKIKAYNKSQLSRLYGVSIYILNTWIKKHQEKIGDFKGMYTPKQVEIIFECLGSP